VARNSSRTMAELLTFAGFVFSRTDRILERDGRRIALAPKAAEALGLLLAEPGALVTKQAMRDALWPDGFIEDNNLSQTIYVLRKALDPDGDGRAFIETLARRGYRFVAPVAPYVAVPRTDAPPAAAPPAMPSRRRLWHAAVLAAGVLLALVIGPSAGAHRAGPTAAPLTGDAARAYTLGRYYWDQRTPETLRASAVQFRRVIALAPKSPLGYAGLADAYFMGAEYEVKSLAPTSKQAWAMSEQLARKALTRDPQSAEATAVLGELALDRDHDLARSQRYISEALALKPDYPTAQQFAGLISLYRGNVADALRHLRRATELLPTSVPILTWYGIAQYYNGDYLAARTTLNDAIVLAPSKPEVRAELVFVDEKLGRFDEARMLLRGLTSSPHKHGETWVLGALLDLRTHAVSVAKIAARHAPADVKPGAMAALDVALGRREDALRHLNDALRDPDERLRRGMLALDPMFSELRDDPRFRTLTSG
jgi:DNA-binding winged helix-turn-helix (wHTH) protein/Flp pilus assembly protein TadD